VVKTNPMPAHYQLYLLPQKKTLRQLYNQLADW